MSVRDLIRERLAERGLTMKEASEGMGRNHAYLQQYLERGVPALLPEDAREALAPLLGLKPDELRERAGLKPEANDNLPRPPRKVVIARSQAALRAQAGERLAVLGSAEGGSDGHTPWNGDIVDYVPRPANLVGVPQAYAIYVYGTSMEPRYFPGELLYVHPGRPVHPGCFVLVQLKPRKEGEVPRAFLKRLVRQTQTKLILEQFNPARQFDVKLADVLSTHRIVGSGEA